MSYSRRISNKEQYYTTTFTTSKTNQPTNNRWSSEIEEPVFQEAGFEHGCYEVLTDHSLLSRSITWNWFAIIIQLIARKPYSPEMQFYFF